MRISSSSPAILSRTSPGILAASAALLIAACSVPQDASNEAAQQAFEDGRYGLANVQLAEILSRGDATSETYLIRARLKLAVGDGYAALASIENVSSADLNDAERQIATAHALILQGKAERALELYSEADPADLSEQDLRMVLWGLRELGNDEAFAAGMDVALEAYPDSVDINVLAGNQLLDLGQVEEAASFADAALNKQAENFDVRLLQGRLAIAEDDLEQALEHYTKASEIWPSHALPQGNIAGLQLDLGRVEEARATLDPAMVRHPGEPFLQWMQARLALASGDLDGARLALETARPVFRGTAEFMLLSAQIEDQSGNGSLALWEYQQYLDEVGSDEAIELRIAQLTAD